MFVHSARFWEGGKMTTREQVLGFIELFRAAEGYSPSYQEIVVGCNLSSTSVVAYHVARLEEMGVLRRQRNVPRSLVVVRDGVDVMSCGHPRSALVGADDFYAGDHLEPGAVCTMYCGACVARDRQGE